MIGANSVCRRFAFSILMCVCSTLATSISYAATEDPVAYLRKELKIEFSTFGKGMAEAFRNTETRAVPKKESEYVVRSEQAGANFTINWVTKKSEPDAPFPEYMKLRQAGAILLGDIILGKASKTEVISHLGPPDSQSSETLTYSLPGYQGDDTAIFTFHQGTLKMVEWLWFVD